MQPTIFTIIFIFEIFYFDFAMANKSSIPSRTRQRSAHSISRNGIETS